MPKPARRTNQTVTHNAEIRAIRDYLAVLGGFSIKIGGGGFQKPGLPDLICHLKGRALYIEVKTGAARLSAAQEAIKDTIERTGGLYIVAHSVLDVEDVLLARGMVTPSLQRHKDA